MMNMVLVVGQTTLIVSAPQDSTHLHSWGPLAAEEQLCCSRDMAAQQAAPLAQRLVSSINDLIEIVDVTKPDWNQGPVPLAIYMPVSQPTDRAANAAVACSATLHAGC
jgi:hypothetical protein